MKNKKILSLIVAAGMIVGTTGMTPVIANAQGINNVKTYSNVQPSAQKAVVNKTIAVMNGNKIIGYTNPFDMATVITNNGSTCKVTTEFGLIGTVETSALNMVNSGVNQSLNVLNEDAHVANVTTVLNVRAEATTNSAVKAQLTNNTNFKIVGQQGDWLKINIEGISGFIFNEFSSKGTSSVGGQVVTGSNIKTSTTSSTVITSNGTTGSTGNAVAGSVPTKSTSSTGNVIVSNTNKTISIEHLNDNTPSKTTPIEHHNDNTPSKTTPIEHHNDNTPNKTTPVEHHNDNTPSKTTPVEHHNDNTPNKTTPIEHHNDNTPNKTTPVEHHNDNTPSKTTPVEHHNDNTPSKTTPVEHHNDNTPSKTTPTQQEYTYMPQLSQNVLDGINQLRTNAGIKALPESSSANATAYTLAKDMAGAGNADHSYNEMGAMSPVGTSSYIVNMFKNSAEHYNELTTKAYEGIGVAVFKNNQTGEYFTAVKFVAPTISGGTTHNML